MGSDDEQREHPAVSIQRPAARYRQVADDLRAAISRGTYPAGTALPSQPTLAREYGLNQTSISRAIALLEAEGLVRTEHGRGCFVADIPRVKRVRRVPPRGNGTGSAFSEDVRKAGMTARTELVEVAAIDPPERIAVLLDLAAGEQVVLRKRHMFADERPVQVAASYIPMSVAGGTEIAMPDTGPTGMRQRLADRGHRIVRFGEEVEVRRPTPEEAEFLGITAAQNVLEVVRSAFGPTGRPLEVVTNVFPSQLWKLAYEWPADDAASADLPTHSVSVTGIVVRSDGCVLAIRRDDDGRWVPPGGVLELDETPFAGVVREVLEETGVRVEPMGLTGVYKNMHLGVVSLGIRCRLVEGEPTATDEASSVAWLSQAEAAEMMPEARAVRVTDAFRDDGPFIRTHDGQVLLD